MRYKKKDNVCIEAFPVKGCEIVISKPNGEFAVALDGDWLVRGIKGDLYPIENKNFMKLYEVIPDAGN
jgi:hypothetical protein